MKKLPCGCSHFWAVYCSAADELFAEFERLLAAEGCSEATIAASHAFGLHVNPRA